MVKHATSLFNWLCSNVARQVARFLLPVFPYFKLGRLCYISSTVIVRYSFALHVISDFLWSSCFESCEPKDTR